MELILVLPLLIGIFFAMVEFGILLYSQQQLQNGCREACRVAALPGADDESVLYALKESLQWKRLVQGSVVEKIDLGSHSGDRVELQVSVPMNVATPDMLRFLGFSLRDRKIYARCVMRKE